MKRRLLILVLVLSALAVQARADLIINITVVPLVLGDVIELSITNAGGGDLRAVLTYEMKTDTGAVYKRGSNSQILTPAQKTAIMNVLNNDFIPAANVAEGL
jgi:hypothetical protein